MLSELSLTNLRSRLHYCPDSGVFTRLIDAGKKYKAGSTTGSRHSKGYISIRLDDRLYFAHRLAWFYMTGQWPSQIDHINRKRDDNRWNNLREVTPEQNQHNRDVLGVHQHTQTRRWVAQISRRGKAKHLGCYGSQAEAIAVRREAENSYAR